QRGDLGRIQLERGQPVRGRVVDLQGKPLAGVFLSLYPVEAAKPKYSGNLTEDLHREAGTDASGNFTFAPLPAGEYLLNAEEFPDNHPAIRNRPPSLRRELPGVFIPRKVTIAAGQALLPMDYRESPAVVVKGKYAPS